MSIRRMSGTYIISRAVYAYNSKHSRFFGIVQAGYRKLLTRVTAIPKPTSIDIQGSDSDSIIERPRTPRTFSRVSSFNKSFRIESGENGEDEEDGSPFFNQFTTVSKGYGKSLVHPTSPAKIRTPRPVSTPSRILGPMQLKTGEHRTEILLPIPAPSSPTTIKPETRSRVPITNPRDLAGVDDTEIGNNVNGISLLPGNPGPSRGSSLRSSKRLREDREGGSKINEQPGSDGTTTKRQKL